MAGGFTHKGVEALKATEGRRIVWEPVGHGPLGSTESFNLRGITCYWGCHATVLGGDASNRNGPPGPRD